MSVVVVVVVVELSPLFWLGWCGRGSRFWSSFKIDQISTSLFLDFVGRSPLLAFVCVCFVCCRRVAHGSSSGGPLEPVPLPHGKLIQPGEMGGL
jgi:hypothetical protein